MDKVKFLNDDLKHFFTDKPFDTANDLDGDIFRKYENRVTKRFELKQKNYFIKTHGPVGWKEILKNLIQFKTPVIGAKREYQALNHLSKYGVKCPEVRGFGLRGLNPADSSSFLITKELHNTISLEDFFFKRIHEKLSFKDKKNLITKVASLIRRMHATGLNHRDLYLCHIHIQKNTDINEVDLSLIDLHRAQIRSEVPLRWLVKDLGGFIHSVLQFNLTERDFYRFFMTYFDCSLELLLQTHQKLLQTILDRAFEMYLKPQVKGISLNFRDKEVNESGFSKYIEDKRRFVIRKDKELFKDQILKFLDDEESLINAGEVIKNERGHLVVKLKLKDQDFYFKKYRIKNIYHGFTRLMKPTRANNSMKATLWLNAVGIKTATPILFCEDKGFLGARASYLVTESIVAKSLDDALMIKDDHIRIISSIEAFFKRINWIGYCHGDAKTSNFFMDKSLIAFDLDSSCQSFMHPFQRKNSLRDKKRILKSLKGYNAIYSKLSKRFHRS